MADLNRLRAKFAVDRSAQRRDDGLKTFDWKGPTVRCLGCGKVGRNLNSADRCTECMGVGTGTPSAAFDPLKAKTVAAFDLARPESKVDLSSWPRKYTPAPIGGIIKEVSDDLLDLKSGKRETRPQGFALEEVELLVHTNEGHNKFYAVARYGRFIIKRWGKIGYGGQEDTEEYPAVGEARVAMRKLIISKEAKGYSPAFHE